MTLSMVEIPLDEYVNLKDQVRILTEENTRMWNRLLKLASFDSAPRNGHTCANMIGLAKNEIRLIQRDRDRRG